MALKHGENLMATFARLIDTRDKYRGKGQQKVTVEHVHVNAGGQAIVGTVDGTKGKKVPPRPRWSMARVVVADFDSSPEKARPRKGS